MLYVLRQKREMKYKCGNIEHNWSEMQASRK